MVLFPGVFESTFFLPNDEVDLGLAEPSMGGTNTGGSILTSAFKK